MEKSINDIIGKLKVLKKTAKELCITRIITKKVKPKTKKVRSNKTIKSSNNAYSFSNTRSRGNKNESGMSNRNKITYPITPTPTPELNQQLSFPQSDESTPIIQPENQSISSVSQDIEPESQSQESQESQNIEPDQSEVIEAESQSEGQNKVIEPESNYQSNEVQSSIPNIKSNKNKNKNINP